MLISYCEVAIDRTKEQSSGQGVAVRVHECAAYRNWRWTSDTLLMLLNISADSLNLRDL